MINTTGYTFSLRNFQTHRSGKVHFPIGVTAILGASNNGKSAIRRALNCLLFNEYDKSFITYGKKSLELGLSFDGHNISYKRPANSYLIDSNLFNKVGRGTPKALQELGFSKLDSGEKLHNLHTPSQLDGLFFITESPIEQTRILNSVFQVEKYERAVLNAKSDKLATAKNLTIVESKIKDIKPVIVYESKRVDLLTQLDSTEVTLDLLNDFLALTDSLSLLKNHLYLLDKFINVSTTYLNLLSYISIVSTITDLNDNLLSLNKEIMRLDRVLQLLLQVRAKQVSISFIESYTSLISIRDKQVSQISSLTRSEANLSRLISLVHIVSDIIQYQSIYSDISAFSSQLTKLNSSLSNLSRLISCIHKRDSVNSYLALVDTFSFLQSRFNLLSKLDDKLTLTLTLSSYLAQLHYSDRLHLLSDLYLNSLRVLSLLLSEGYRLHLLTLDKEIHFLESQLPLCECCGQLLHFKKDS